MKVVHQILAVVVTGLMLLGVVEGGLRLIGFGPRPTMNRFDERLGWTKTPDASIRRQTGEFDVVLSTNSRGLREAESRGYEKAPDASRILLVGDSFTLGYTVDRPHTISALLEARLAAEGRTVEVVNGGTEGYSTDQEVLWLAEEGVKYSPDVVVLQMYENDIFWNGQDRYLRYPKPRLDPQAVDLSALTSLQDPGLEPWWIRRTALGNLVGRTLWPPEVPLLDGPTPLPAEWAPRLRESASGWPETAAALRAFGAVARDMGAKPLVLVIPDKAQIEPPARARMERMLGAGYDPDRPFEGMLSRAEEAGLDAVDPRGSLRSVSAREGQPLYFDRDWHTNGLGNRVLAEDLAAALAAPGFLGPPPRLAGSWGPAEGPTVPSTLGRNVLIALALWLLLGTLFLRRFPDQGVAGSYGPVGLLVGTAFGLLYGVDWIAGLLPVWLGRMVPGLVVAGVVGASLWYLRKRLGVMAELFGTFVRRGQWYVLPVLAGLLSLGALLVVAASSPWLAPFIYTLF